MESYLQFDANIARFGFLLMKEVIKAWRLKKLDEIEGENMKWGQQRKGDQNEMRWEEISQFNDLG